MWSKVDFFDTTATNACDTTTILLRKPDFIIYFHLINAGTRQWVNSVNELEIFD